MKKNKDISRWKTVVRLPDFVKAGNQSGKLQHLWIVQSINIERDEAQYPHYIHIGYQPGYGDDFAWSCRWQGNRM